MPSVATKINLRQTTSGGNPLGPVLYVTVEKAPWGHALSSPLPSPNHLPSYLLPQPPSSLSVTSEPYPSPPYPPLSDKHPPTFPSSPPPPAPHVQPHIILTPHTRLTLRDRNGRRAVAVSHPHHPHTLYCRGGEESIVDKYQNSAAETDMRTPSKFM